MSAFTDAIARLASYFNGSDYNASTNPGGLAAGGHRTNFVPSLQDVATVGAGVASLADAAATSESKAAASAATAAAAVSALRGTSTTSKAIAMGAVGPFTTQTGKSWSAGTWVNVRSAANPLLNYMVGQVTAYAAGSLTVNVQATGGSGTFSDWIIEVSSAPGQTGGQGVPGARGSAPDFLLTFGNGTSDSDPGNGAFKFSNAVLSAVDYVFLDNLNTASQDISAWLDALDDSTTSGNRGRLRFYDPGGGATFVDLKVTGAVVDGGGYRKVPVTAVAASVALSAGPPFTNGAAVAVHFTSTGNKGADGGGAGDVVGPSSATEDTLPLFDTSSGKLIKESGVGIGTAGANVGRLDTDNTHSGAQTFAAAVEIKQNVALSGDISPAQITGNQNDFNPTGLSTASVLRLTCDAGVNLTGLAGGGDGRVLIVRNVGTNDLTLVGDSASSTAINRFNWSGNRVVRPGASFLLQYDAVASRWAALSVTELTKQSSVIDATADRVMVTGAFGLGGQSVSLTSGDSATADRPNGLYYCPSGVTDTPGGAEGWLRVMNVGANYRLLEFFLVATQHSYYLGAVQAGTWGGWSQVYLQENALDAVSQSGGVPTGGLIERGSNANGWFAKFADGTLICGMPAVTFGTVTTATGALFAGTQRVDTLPAAFVGSYSMAGAADSATIWPIFAASTTSTYAVNLWCYASVASSRKYSALAIGKWF